MFYFSYLTVWGAKFELVRKSRHFRFLLRQTSDMKPPLPVTLPFRQRLFPRQHASEYRLWACTGLLDGLTGSQGTTAGLCASIRHLRFPCCRFMTFLSDRGGVYPTKLRIFLRKHRSTRWPRADCEHGASSTRDASRKVAARGHRCR